MLRAIPFLFLLLFFTPSIFAQEVEEAQIDVHTGINDFFDGIGDFAQANTNSSEWFDQEKKDQINQLTHSGVHTGKTAFNLWFAFHEFVVDAIFAGSPVPFDKGIIILVSFVLGTLLVFALFWSFIKRMWKIVLVLIAIIIVIIILPIEFPSL